MVEQHPHCDPLRLLPNKAGGFVTHPDGEILQASFVLREREVQHLVQSSKAVVINSLSTTRDDIAGAGFATQRRGGPSPPRKLCLSVCWSLPSTEVAGGGGGGTFDKDRQTERELVVTEEMLPPKR